MCPDKDPHKLALEFEQLGPDKFGQKYGLQRSELELLKDKKGTLLEDRINKIFMARGGTVGR